MTSSEPGSTLDPEEILAHTDWLRALARRLVGGADADDLAQEAQIRALRASGPVHNLRAYLGQTLRNVASRRSARETLRRDREAMVASEREALEAGQDPTQGSADERVELLEVCLHRLRSLPEAQRRAVTFRYLDGLSFEEIAAREGVRPSTVRSNVSRGIDALREQLDDHAGSRARWCMAIGPWAMGDLGTAGASALNSLAPPTKGAASAAPAGAAVGAGALALMLKPTTLALAGVAAGLAGWFALDGRGAETLRLPSDAADGTRQASGVDEVPTGKPFGPGVLIADDAPERTPAIETSAAPDASVAPLEGQIVDALTGEPVPGVRVQLSANGETVKCGDTDADGRFQGDSAALGSGPVTVVPYDLHASFDGTRFRDAGAPLERPFEGPIPMDIGPTFTPRFAGQALPGGTRFDVVARGPGIPVNRPAKESFPQRKGRSWLRFSRPFSEEAGEWTLEFKSRNGLWAGEARTSRGFGIERKPLDVVLEPRGVLRLTLPESAPAYATTMVTLTSEALATPLSVWMSESDERGGPRVGETEGGASEKIVKHLEPGSYTWSIGSALEGATGDVTVTAGEVVSVMLQVAGGPGMIAVPVDATAVPDADLSEWPVQFFRPEDTSKVFSSHLERAPGGDGHWVVPVESLPEGNWKMVIAPGEGFTTAPLAVDVREALRGEGTLTVTRLVESKVTLTVKAGEGAVPDVSIQHLDGVVARRLERADDGTFTIKVPADHTSAFLVSAEGFDLTWVSYEPGRDGDAIEVNLEPGHRTRAWVIDVESLGPIEGIEVLVDGESVGKTDASGNVWFEAEAAPSTIEIAPASGEGLREMMAPGTPGYAVDVGELGYVFMVAKEG